MIATVEAPCAPRPGSISSVQDKFRLSVSNYKGKSFNWNPPRTLGQFVKSSRTLLRFWTRLVKGGIYHDPIINSSKKLATLYVEFISKHPGLYLPEILTTTLVQDLQSVIDWAPPVDFTGTFTTKRRKHEKNRFCSICGVSLVWPAQLITQKSTTLEIAAESAPIGIMCLNSHHERMEDMIEAVQAPGYFDEMVSGMNMRAGEKIARLTRRSRRDQNQLELTGFTI